MRQNRVGIMPGTGESLIAYGLGKQQGDRPFGKCVQITVKAIPNY
jgi:hypothetical protein